MANTGPITVAQSVVGQPTEIAMGTNDVFARNMKMSDVLTFFDTDGGFEYEFSRTNPSSQPSPSYRAINGEFSTSSSDSQEIKETWEPLGQLVDIDILIRGNKKLPEAPETKQLRDASAQLAREFNDAVFNADNRVVYTTDSKGNKLRRPAGMRQRIQNASTFKMDTGVLLNLGSPDLRRGVATSADTEKTIQNMQDTIAWLNPTHCFLNWYYIGSIGSAIRASKYYDQNRDMYERVVDTFMGVELIDPGYKTSVLNSRDLTDTSTWILGWENSSGVVQTSDPGAGSRYGSQFFAKIGSKNYHGIQPHSFRTEGPITLPNLTQVRFKIEWGYGFASEGFRDVAELYSAKLA